MLLFIDHPNGMCTFEADFNTSHVTVYHVNIRLFCIFLYISIHLMLLFILSRKLYTSHNLYFNTSHVTVYPISFICRFKASSFQYISCYCLSQCLHFHTKSNLISIHLMLLFIDIASHTLYGVKNISIHLMLLFIQR